MNVLSFGDVAGGTTGESITYKIKNDSSGTLTTPILYLANRAIVAQETTLPFYSYWQTPGFNPLVTSSLPITFVNSSSGWQVLINGQSDNVVDEAGNVYIDSAGLLADNTTIYSFQRGSSYEGLNFILNSALTTSYTATLTVYENIWEMNLDDQTWYRDTLVLDDLTANYEFNLLLRAAPYSTAAIGDTYGFLQLITDQEDISIPLWANVLTAQEQTLTNALLLRCSVFSSDVQDTMTEWGVTLTEAS